jgi:Putative Se/S carrier protein-like
VTTDRPEREFVVFLFASTHDAMTAETAVASAGIPGRSIPRPATLGAGCGIALRVAPADADRVASVLSEAGLPPAGRGTILDR